MYIYYGKEPCLGKKKNRVSQIKNSLANNVY